MMISDKDLRLIKRITLKQPDERSYPGDKRLIEIIDELVEFREGTKKIEVVLEK